MFNPNKNNPVKIDISKLQHGISKEQMDKVKYECDLLRMSEQQLIYVAPWLFIEGITAGNTKVIKDEEKEKQEIKQQELEDNASINDDDYSDWPLYDDMG